MASPMLLLELLYPSMLLPLPSAEQERLSVALPALRQQQRSSMVPAPPLSQQRHLSMAELSPPKRRVARSPA